MTKEILLIFVTPLLLLVLVAAVDGKNSSLKRGCVDKQEKK